MGEVLEKVQRHAESLHWAQAELQVGAAASELPLWFVACGDKRSMLCLAARCVQ